MLEKYCSFKRKDKNFITKTKTEDSYLCIYSLSELTHKKKKKKTAILLVEDFIVFPPFLPIP